MRGFLVIATMVAACGLAAGCFEGKADVTLNPDGTGKLVGELTFPMEAPWTTPPKVGDDLRTPEEQMKTVVTAIIKKSTGIDAWKDVSFEQVPGGKVHMKGTAYFKDAAKVKIYPDVRPRFGYGPEGADANMLILTRAADRPEEKIRFKAMSTDESTKAMKDQREIYKKLRPSFEDQLKSLKFDMTFAAPGVIGEVHGFKQQDNSLVVSIDGNRILHALDALVDDSAFLREFVVQSNTITNKWAAEEVRQRLYVNKGEVWAKVNDPLRPQFDYKTESEAAKKAMPDMLVKLGLEEPKAVTTPSYTKTTPAKTSTAAKTPTAAKTSTAPAKKITTVDLPKSLPSMPSVPPVIFPPVSF
jgi:hypothetical protein